MRRDLSPASVAERLEQLRAVYVAETEEQARHRMKPPPRRVDFAEAVRMRLEELRALSDLTDYLHRRSTK